MGWLFVSLIAAVAFGVTLFLTPAFISSALRKGVTARDTNKRGKPLVANMGGFALFAGLAIAVSVGIGYLALVDSDSRLVALLLASLASIALVALVGAYDDLFKISRRLKALLPVVAAVPLMAVTAGDTTMLLSFLGAVDFGLFYTLVLIPLGVTGAANAVNMAAGYNGVEAGTGVIVSAALLAIAMLAGATGPAIILAALLGACLAFLKFNWLPARVFPADIGTYTIGTAIACAAIMGNMESFAVICLLPAFYEFAATVYYSIKGVERRGTAQSPVISAGGGLSPPKGAESYTLFYRILSWRPMREGALVATVLALYAVCGGLALAVYFLKL